MSLRAILLLFLGQPHLCAAPSHLHAHCIIPLITKVSLNMGFNTSSIFDVKAHKLIADQTPAVGANDINP